MTDLLDPAAAAQAWGALESARAPVAPVRHFHAYRPLADAAERIIVEAQDHDRLYTGTPEFDEQMRGIGHGHLMLVAGYSHSGKTQWVLKLLRHNKRAKVAWFTPDEPDTLVLAKLASIESGVAARELEQRIGDGDHEAIKLLRDTALVEFPNLIVFDKPLTPEYMRVGLEEARAVWGTQEDLIVVDYVDLVQAGDSPPAKFDFLKGVVAREKTRMIAIHQTSRSAGADGRKLTISSGNYGGETYAHFMVVVRRKKAQLQADLADLEERLRKGSDVEDKIAEVKHALRIHQYTLSVALVKNKRPGGGLVDEIDLEIDTDTGRLYELPDGDLPVQYQQDLQYQREQRAELKAAGSTSTPTPTWVEQTLDYDPDTKDF